MLRRTPFVVSFFLLTGLGSEWFLWQVTDTTIFLVAMAPVLSMVQLLESNLSVLENLTPLQNEFRLVLPLTVVYFGSLGYWLSQIFREDGLTKYVVLLAVIAFLAAIHWQATVYIDSILYATT